MMILRSIGVLSCGKVMGIICAAVGLIPGLFIALMSMAGVAANAQAGKAGMPFAALGVAAIIILPIIYGVFGFIVGVIQAAIYNVVAGLVGGIELEFVRAASAVQAP